MIIHLGPRLLEASRDLPESSNGPPLALSYSVLLQVGFAQPTSLLVAGELLPHHFTLTPNVESGMFLWHFP